MKTRNRVYSNGEITILWRAGDCTHSTICYRELRAVFDPSRRPWVDPMAGTTEQIKQIIERCPTTALTFLWNDKERNATETSPKLYDGDFERDFVRQPDDEQVKINLRKNGPVIVTGNVQLINEDGTAARPTHMLSLCRCGASRNMPHCDGTHFKIGFRDE